jgi:DNA invertase Pin-like site-specific DNA recombinase
VVGFYEDAGISGAKGREKRPGFDRLLKDATARKIDMIAAWSVDRLGRSLQHLVSFLTELQALDCHLSSLSGCVGQRVNYESGSQ